MRTLKSTTGNVRHVPALGDGTLCNGVGASRGNVRWYWSNGAADCKRCLKLLPGVIAEAWTMAHTTAEILTTMAATVTDAVQVSPATAHDRADTIRTAHRAGLLHTIDGVTFTLTDAGRRAAGPNEVEPGTAPAATPAEIDAAGRARLADSDKDVAESRTDNEQITAKYAPAVTVTRPRVSIATQIAEACTALGIELGNEGVAGEARYIVNGRKYRVVELADLVLEGGFEGAYGRAETIVRQGSPLKPVVADLDHLAAANDAAELELPDYAARRGTLLDLAERAGGKPGCAVPVVPLQSAGGWLLDQGLIQGHIDGYSLTDHGARVVALLTAGSPKRAPLTLTEAAEKITAEYSDALKALGAEEYAAELDARTKAHPYRPAVGELVVGTLKSVVTGKQIGGLQIGVFEGIDARYGLAHLRDGHAGSVVDVDSMRPAPTVPDASHLIGVELTAELAVGDHGLRTGVVASVLRPSADGRYVVMQFEKPTTWVVRVPVGVVERTASMTVSCVEKLPASEGVEHWGVRVKPKSTLVNLVVAQKSSGGTGSTPYAVAGATEGGRHVFAVHDTRRAFGEFAREIRRASGERVTWPTSEEADRVARALWAREVAGERSPGDAWS